FEVTKIQRRLIEKGINRVTDHFVASAGRGGVAVADVYTKTPRELECDAVVMVTARLPKDELYLELEARRLSGDIASVRGIGDAWNPATIAAAVWSGRRAAEEFDAVLPPNDDVPFLREVTQLAPLPLTPTAGAR
ncbi:MAG TPA: NADH:flavin oxidoreductase, partial [Marmoricola sp.]|nr:NADH:flavin oxidoreductase [Marmoricola sp.]